MNVDTAVHLGIPVDETEPQPIAVECPVCYAIVRAVKLADHTHALHARAEVKASKAAAI